MQLYFSTSTGYLDTCQGACQCQHEGLSLVCGKDNIVYYSPCHAGCSSQSGSVRQIAHKLIWKTESNLSCREYIKAGPVTKILYLIHGIYIAQIQG